MLFYILTRLLADGLYNSIATEGGYVLHRPAMQIYEQRRTENGGRNMGQLYHKQNGGYDE